MFRNTVLMSFALLLAACSSNSYLHLTENGEKIFKENRINYKVRNIEFVSNSEAEDTDAGNRGRPPISMGTPTHFHGDAHPFPWTK